MHTLEQDCCRTLKSVYMTADNTLCASTCAHASPTTSMLGRHLITTTAESAIQ